MYLGLGVFYQTCSTQVNTSFCMLCNQIPFFTVGYFSPIWWATWKKSQLSVDAKPTHSGHSQLFKVKRPVNSGDKHSWECIWKWSTSNLKPTLNDRCGNKPHVVRKRKCSSNEHFLIMAQAFNVSYERSHIHWTGVDSTTTALEKSAAGQKEGCWKQ